MTITWYGFSSFKLEGQKASVILDPFDNSGGLRQPRYVGDVTVSTTDSPLYNNIKKIKDSEGGQSFIITGPGEYEVGGIFVHGVKPKNGDDNKSQVSTLYKIDIDGMSIATLGSINHDLTDAELEILEGVHILFIPVGGHDVLNAKQATQMISQIEPRIVIPMHYKVPGVKPQLDSLDLFKKEIGVAPEEALPKYKIQKKDLPSGEMKVVVLKP